jgi:hypothetical protein
MATVAAMRNLAGRRFSATSKYHDSAPRIAGSSQILSRAKSLMNRSPWLYLSSITILDYIYKHWSEGRLIQDGDHAHA